MIRYLNLISFLCLKPSVFLFLFSSYLKYFFSIKTKPIVLNKIWFNIDRSFIRWWDWETLILLGISFIYEDWNPELSRKFLKILNYKWDDFILWLPFLYIQDEEENTSYLRSWIITRNYFNKIQFSKKEYWDAFYFINLWNISKFIELYKNKKIFLISNVNTIDKSKKIKNLNFVWFQEIPDKKSYKLYNKIKNQTIEKLNLLEKKDLIIIISWWPLAKVLSYDLTIDLNYVCHDVWSYFDRNL